ncbi:hypothetical protein D8M06_15965 [Oceanobacillus halophilus]|uniref:Uncharacterized protein n=1 Tax=Oceanobacillus halophilus TaxID=930130 RepID=A0A494ZVB8_9BACI|nr:hypothetical protein D8M06_15965 [Oceanobacillus halophilus]
MLILAEILRAISILVLLVSSSFYFRSLDRKKKQSKLSTFEFTMYIIIQVAYILFTISLLVFIFFD